MENEDNPSLNDHEIEELDEELLSKNDSIRIVRRLKKCQSFKRKKNLQNAAIIIIIIIRK